MEGPLKVESYIYSMSRCEIPKKKTNRQDNLRNVFDKLVLEFDNGR